MQFYMDNSPSQGEQGHPTNEGHPVKTKQGKIIWKRFHIKLKSNLCSFETEHKYPRAILERKFSSQLNLTPGSCGNTSV